MMIHHNYRAGNATERRDAALKLLDRENSLRLLVIRHQFVEILLMRGTASLNDLELPPELRGKFLGSLHRPFIALNAITEAGLVRSNRPNCHRRRVCLWRILDSAKLHGWIQANPLPSPGPARQQMLAFESEAK